MKNKVVNIEPGDLIFFRGKALISKVIQYITKSEYSHVALVYQVEAVQNEHLLVVIEAIAQGVVIRSMMFDPLVHEHVAPKVPGHDEFVATETRKHAIGLALNVNRERLGYDFLGVMGLLFSYGLGWTTRKWQNRKAYFCSELVTYVYGNAISLRSSHETTPGSLYNDQTGG